MLLWNEVWYFFNLQINEALGNENTSYRRHQSSGEELPTRLYRVKKGTFNKLGDYLIEANPSTSPIQFETPRFITKKEAGDLLLANLHPQHVPSTWPPGTLNGLPSSHVFLTFIILRFFFFIVANRVLGKYLYKPEVFFRDDVLINASQKKVIPFFFKEMNLISRKDLIIKHSYLSYRPEKFTYWHAWACIPYIWCKKGAL